MALRPAIPTTPRSTHAAPRRPTRLAWALALGWVAALLAILALYQFVGEEAWPVLLLLYLPRHVWLLPGLALLPAASRPGRRALLWPLGAGALLWLFPIMGFVLPGGAPAGGPALRVLTWNTTHAKDGVAGVRAVLDEARPDLVLFQWTSRLAEEALTGPGFEGWTVRRAGQFTIASRFPLGPIEGLGLPSGTGPPCAHAVVESPLGPLDVYSMRPQSARQELGATRSATRGLSLGERLTGLLEGATSGQFEDRTAFRDEQTRSVAEAVAAARHPVVLAGDSNLPDGSAVLRRHFGRLHDAFAEAGWGFGYTHPAKAPWMRLNRVLTTGELAAISVEVLGRRQAAHRPVVVVLTSRPGR